MEYAAVTMVYVAYSPTRDSRDKEAGHRIILFPATFSLLLLYYPIILEHSGRIFPVKSLHLQELRYLGLWVSTEMQPPAQL